MEGKILVIPSTMFGFSMRAMFRAPIRYSFAKALSNSFLHGIKMRNYSGAFPLGIFTPPSYTRNHINKLKNKLNEIQSQGCKTQEEVYKEEIKQKVKLNPLQKDYLRRKPDFDPTRDSKPVFSSSYTKRAPATRANGGLRGSRATRWK